VRILVVEDEKKVARFLERGLKEEHYAVDVAHDGEDGLFRGLNTPYDLIVLDVLLPKKDGVHVLREWRAAGVMTRVLMLTARDSVEDRVRGLDAGADDYLVKPFAFAELLARVRALLRRSGKEAPSTLVAADLVLDLKTRKVSRGGRPVVLSAKEFGVLDFLLPIRGRSSPARNWPSTSGMRTSIPSATSSMSRFITCARKWIATFSLRSFRPCAAWVTC
jgi:DNA-binding response OmpR family regulator